MNPFSANFCPTEIFAATSSAGDRITGIGQTVPLASRISRQTRSKSFCPMNPLSGENAPMAIISRSNASRGDKTTDGKFTASAVGATTRLTSDPPCGAMSDIENLLEN